MLGLLQRMSVENIMIVVYLWHNKMPGSNSSEVFRNVLERAKDLLNTLHKKVIEAETMLAKRLEEQQKPMLALSPPQMSPARVKGKANTYVGRQRKEQLKLRHDERGQDLITKVYPSDVIPDQFVERKRDYRPNNFLGAV